ncbi:hypothetical protein H633G_11469 [Metarhizium anisopliae BRIP 53284]|nr:hypothetical protein H633G_11469 [Metarhizium anisopliae BRIP 53284]
MPFTLQHPPLYLFTEVLIQPPRCADLSPRGVADLVLSDCTRETNFGQVIG